MLPVGYCNAPFVNKNPVSVVGRSLESSHSKDTNTGNHQCICDLALVSEIGTIYAILLVNLSR